MDASSSRAEGGVITTEPMRTNVMSPGPASPPWDPADAPVLSSQMDNAAVCPPGMEYLLQTSMILVQQQVELLEGYEANNRYAVLDMAGKRMYFAVEQSRCWLRCCFGQPLTILLLNNQGEICLRVERKCTKGYCLSCGSCYGEAQIHSANNIYLGKIAQNFCDCCCPRLTIYDGENNKSLGIKGPCNCCLCCYVRFTVHDVNGVEVGEIKKKWGGLSKEMFTGADTFGVSFPLLMDPRLKTLLLGAVFLIDFMYFENAQDQDSSALIVASFV